LVSGRVLPRGYSIVAGGRIDKARDKVYRVQNIIDTAAVAVEVGEGFGVVGDHGVKVEGLRVGEVGVGDRSGDGRPIGAEPAAEAVGVIAGTELVVTGFRVALFALEFIVLRAGVGVGALAAVGVKVSVVANDARVCS